MFGIIERNLYYFSNIFEEIEKFEEFTDFEELDDDEFDKFECQSKFCEDGIASLINKPAS